MKVKSESEVAQSCPTLSGPTDCSLPGSSVHAIFQARVLEWGAATKILYVATKIWHSQINFFSKIEKASLKKKKKQQQGSLGDSVVRNPPANAGDMGLIPDLGRSHMLQSN